MSGEGGGAGAGAGSAPVQPPAPFQMDSARLKQLMLKDDEANVADLEALLGCTVEVWIGRKKKPVGLNVTKNGTTVAHPWAKIATMFESGELATDWGISQVVLNKFFENGS